MAATEPSNANGMTRTTGRAGRQVAHDHGRPSHRGYCRGRAGRLTGRRSDVREQVAAQPGGSARALTAAGRVLERAFRRADHHVVARVDVRLLVDGASFTADDDHPPCLRGLDAHEAPAIENVVGRVPEIRQPPEAPRRTSGHRPAEHPLGARGDDQIPGDGPVRPAGREEELPGVQPAQAHIRRRARRRDSKHSESSQQET